MGYPWGRHAGSPSRQALGDGWEESWSFPQSFSLQGTAKLAAEGVGRGKDPGEGDDGQGAQGLTLTCKVQLPHKLGCFLNSDIRINTDTATRTHAEKALHSPGWGSRSAGPKELQAGARQISADS